jgi:hypothetical protein
MTSYTWPSGNWYVSLPHIKPAQLCGPALLLSWWWWGQWRDGNLVKRTSVLHYCRLPLPIYIWKICCSSFRTLCPSNNTCSCRWPNHSVIRITSSIYYCWWFHHQKYSLGISPYWQGSGVVSDVCAGLDLILLNTSAVMDHCPKLGTLSALDLTLYRRLSD